MWGFYSTFIKLAPAIWPFLNNQSCRWLSRRNLRGGQTQNKATPLCSNQALNTFKKEGGGFLLRATTLNFRARNKPFFCSAFCFKHQFFPQSSSPDNAAPRTASFPLWSTHFSWQHSPEHGQGHNAAPVSHLRLHWGPSLNPHRGAFVKSTADTESSP